MEKQIRAVGVGRAALGVAFLLLPGKVMRVWFGPGGDEGPVARMMGRSAGGRDLALGLGLLFALRHGSSVRGWLEAIVVADATDVVAVAIASRDLPSTRTLLSAIPPVVLIALGRRLVSQLPPSGAAEPATVP